MELFNLALQYASVIIFPLIAVLLVYIAFESSERKKEKKQLAKDFDFEGYYKEHFGDML